MTTIRDKLIAAIIAKSAYAAPQDYADACLAVLAAEPVSEEAIDALIAAENEAVQLADPDGMTLEESRRFVRRDGFEAGWHAMLGMKP